MKRAAAYMRVSSEEQLDNFSLPAQKDAIEKFVAMRGWTLVKVYEERGRSGRTVYRPEFQAMIAAAERGAFDVIVVHKVDRFSRSLLDALTYLKHLKEAGVSFVSVSEDFDFTTPIGGVLLALLVAFAQLFIDNLAGEIRKGKRQRARQGYWNGQLSWGYTTRRAVAKRLTAMGPEANEQTVNALESALEQYAHLDETAAFPDPVNAAGVLLAFTEYSKGIYSDADIARMLNHAGYRMTGTRGDGLLTKDTIQDMLCNRFYLGETSIGVRHNRQWMQGNHEPIISQQLFDDCQRIRKHRRQRFDRGQIKRRMVYPLSGLIICAECGSFWRGWNHRGKPRYRDVATQSGKSCTQPASIHADKLDKQILSLFAGMRLPDDWKQRALAMLNTTAAGSHGGDNQSIQTRLERLKTLFELGDISKTEYQVKRDELRAQIVDEPVSVSMVDLERAAVLLNDLPKLWQVATLDERKQLARAMFNRIYMREGRIIAIEPTPILWVLLSDTGSGRDRSPSLDTAPLLIHILAPNTPFSTVKQIAA